MNLPTFQRKQKLRAADLQTLSDAVRANRILPGFGIRITGSPNGTTISVAARNGAPGGSIDIHPFQCIRSVPYEGTGNPPANQGLKFKVRPGVVMGLNSEALWPENINETFTAPDNKEQYWCWIKVTLLAPNDGNSVEVQSVEIQAGNSVPTPEKTEGRDLGDYPTSSFCPIFFVETKDNQIKSVGQMVKSSLSLVLAIHDLRCTGTERRLFWVRL